MSKMLRVSESYHSWLMAHQREGESVEETLRRLTRPPDPEIWTELFDEETAEQFGEAIRRKRSVDADRRAELRERFTGLADSDEGR